MGGRSNGEYKKGLWSEEEDKILMDYIKVHGKGKWTRVAKETGLKRCGKSCRLRWMNYLSPNVKHGDFSDEENDLIIRLHKLLGNRWSLIAGRVPGRTDNQVKNHWNTHLSKRLDIIKRNQKIYHSSFNFSKDIGDNLINNIYSKSNSVLYPVHNDGSTSNNAKKVRSTENVLMVTDTNDPTSIDCHESLLLLNNDFNSYTPNFMEFLDDHLDILCQGL